MERIRLNGGAATPAALAQAALVNYGHFTTLRVAGGAARGLGLHLARLAAATQALFGCALDVGRVRDWMRAAMAGIDGERMLRVTVFARAFDRRDPLRPVVPDVLVSVHPAPAAAAAPLRVRSVVHGRALPAIKHVGAFDLLYRLRQARLAGADDALFVDADDRIAEGTTWNIGFWDGATAVFPDAPALPGITAHLVREGLARRGMACAERTIRLDELGDLDGAFAMNAGGIRAIVGIDDRAWPAAGARIGAVEAAWAAAPPEPL
ncbi:aminotransferase class IV [Coralloluteibacterium stylophorae]|uniref:Aminotransferase class IV n=1 Tax=Coralloluteibacterium stylophorae TaxID=1776034 RepID=A0A8J7VSW5_9GAMM|nr:aminotransferase class IV [Coralloluteibacterium stylophorae]